MSIYSLTPQDFQLQNGTLLTTVQGASFVMFITENCKFCHQFMPQFSTLPSQAYGVTFAICSVDGAGKEIHRMSHQSSSPITAAPTFIFYNNGVPFAEYKGPRTVQSIIQFIQGAIAESNKQQARVSQAPAQTLRTRQNDQTQRQMPTIQPPQPVQNSGMLQAPGLPRQPQGIHAQQSHTQQPKWTVSPTTGVKEFETSYGRPYNTANDQEFLEYERAYLESK